MFNKLLVFRKNSLFLISLLIILLLSLGIVHGADNNLSFSNSEIISDSNINNGPDLENDCDESSDFISDEVNSQESNVNDNKVSDAYDNLDDENSSLNSNSSSSSHFFYNGNGGLSVVGDSFEDLQEAIDFAKENDTVSILKSMSGNGVPIIVNKSLTIDGNGVTLDGRYLSRIFYISSDNVVLKDLNMIQGANNLTPYSEGVSNNNGTLVTKGISTDYKDLMEGAGAAIRWLGNNGCIVNS